MLRTSLYKAMFYMAAGAFALLIVLNLTPERREVREPIPHVQAVSDAGFPATMSSMFPADIHGGHAIETLVNGDEIFAAMLGGIESAGSTINFETYVYWSGRIARQFADALAAKAREGVEVRVLVDWAGSIPFEQELVDIMEAGGVTFHRFRKPAWYTFDRVNNRTHRKLLIIDGTLGFTGGVGIGDQWLGDARNPDEWRENHYRITGPAVSQMQAAFAENWLEATGEVLQGPTFYPEQPTDGSLYAHMVKSSPQGGSRSMHQMLLVSMASASQHIRIAMAYLVPDQVVINQLVEARGRGVEVDIIVPGEHMAVDVVRRGSRSLWGPLLEAGVRIHEYEPTMFHAKKMIIDEAFVTIGSSNLDERSFRLNDEANLNVYGTEFAAEQIALFEEDLANSRQVSLEEWQNRPWTEKAGDFIASLARSQL
jgi:cardiolipin synthase A/B